jgi:hypothetical protein
VIEVGEICDGNCPGSNDCDDHNPCTYDDLKNQGECNYSCRHEVCDGAGERRRLLSGSKEPTDNDCN